MTLFCPVTGLPVTTRPEWRYAAADETYSVTFHIVGKSIVYSAPRGFTTLPGIRSVMALYETVVQDIPTPDGRFIQIEDYAALQNSTLDARKYFIDYMNRNKRFAAVVFCNLSTVMTIGVKIGRRFSMANPVIHTASDYAEAILRALELSKKNVMDQGPGVFREQTRYQRQARTLVPGRYETHPEWARLTDTFGVSSAIIDDHILYSRYTGHFLESHVPLVRDLKLSMESLYPSAAPPDFWILDSSGLSSVDPKAGGALEHYFKQGRNRVRNPLYITCGPLAILPGISILKNPFLPFTVKSVRDLNQAFSLIQDSRSPDIQSHSTTLTNPSRIKGYAQELQTYIQGIHWEKEGAIDITATSDGDHPFNAVYLSLKLVKEELDGLFRERQMAEEALKKSEEKYRDLFEKSSDVLCIHDLEGNILETNLAFKQDYDFTEPELVNLNIRDILAPEFRRELPDYLGRVSTLGKDRGLVSIETPRGKRAVFEYTNVLLVSPDGTPNSIKVSARDVTSRLHAEKQKKKIEAQRDQIHRLEAIGTLAGGIAHDFNNLLLGVFGNLSLAKMELSPGNKVYQIITETETNISRATDLSNQLLTFARGGDPIKKAITLGQAIAVDSFPSPPPKTAEAMSPSRDATPPVPRILIMDDDPTVRDITKKMMEKMGLSAELSEDGLEAIEKYRQALDSKARFDLVIMDLTIPGGMGGKEAIAEILKLDPDARAIVASGYSTDAVMSGFQSHGFKGIIVKPYSFQELKTVLDRVMNS
ncbi:MAG: response regulator [Pseudomonadota bacterium]